MALALVTVVGIGGLLIASQERQGRGAALSEADNRAAVLRQLIIQLTAAQSQAAARDLAAQPALIDALGAGTQERLDQLFAATRAPDLPGEEVLVVNAPGTARYMQAGPDLAGRSPENPGDLLSLRDALLGRIAPGIEFPAPGTGAVPSLDVAVPVRSGATVIGAVAYLAPLDVQLQRYTAIVGYPTAYVAPSHPGQIGRPTNRRGAAAVVVSSTPADISAGIVQGVTGVHAIYSRPGGDVAGGFVPLPGVDGRAGVYIGVEASLAAFLGDRATDAGSLALLGLLALALITIVGIVFVDRVVRRPLARLEREITRIAGGDVSSDIEITSGGEIGRMAAGVNRMRRLVAAKAGEVEQARSGRGPGVEQLETVSRALTTTTSGVRALSQAVVAAVVSIGGDGSAGLLLGRDGDRLVTLASDGIDMGSPIEDDVIDRLLAGEPVRSHAGPAGWEAAVLTAVPLFHRDWVAGALALLMPPGATGAGDEPAWLAVLATNAAVALENTQLFEREQETVRRLRDPDQPSPEVAAPSSGLETP